MNAPRSLLALALAASAGCVASRPPPSGHAAIDRWERRHPVASQELGVWVRNHPRAAKRFFTWDSRHPGAAEAFVDWAIRNPAADVDVFALEHRGWDDFNWVMEHHRPAANAFMAWCRRHPEASLELMRYPAGLHWAGTHLYQGTWEMERAG
jgi:hypothetical protein